MTRPPRLVGICYPDTSFGRNLPLGDLPTVHCRLRVLRPLCTARVASRNIVAISRTSWPKVSWRGWICAFGTTRLRPSATAAADRQV